MERLLPNVQVTCNPLQLLINRELSGSNVTICGCATASNPPGYSPYPNPPAECPTFGAARLESATTSTQSKVFGNNGATSCEQYCRGINGGPWNNELPRDWNGAKCVGHSETIKSCFTGFTYTYSTYCVCAKTGSGWDSRGWRGPEVLPPTTSQYSFKGKCKVLR